MEDSFSNYFTAENDVDTARSIIRKLKERDNAVQKLILRLNADYPGDIGVMMPLLLNYLVLESGECFYMAPNEPHAYLKGDLIEVMACSDNVIRVGLTPKHRDIPLLYEILTYKMEPPPIIKPQKTHFQYCTKFTPPATEFELEMINLPFEKVYYKKSITVPSLLLVIKGEGSVEDDDTQFKLLPGVSLFISAGCHAKYVSLSDELIVAITHSQISKPDFMT
mmetsp:Transcript_672/g.952  ORF Transcript_672/g.952 Transcript_672/m.952 type:complete len:222 (+) Transcript_672:1116-1781(+)